MKHNSCIFVYKLRFEMCDEEKKSIIEHYEYCSDNCIAKYL